MRPVKIGDIYYAFWTCTPGYCDKHSEPKRHKASLYTGDKREAAYRCADLEKRLSDERARNSLGLPAAVKSGMLLSTYFKQYAERVQHDKALSTQATEQCHMATFLGIVGDRPLSELTPEVCEKYKTARLKKIAPRSWNSELSTLKAIFGHGLTWHPKPFSANPLAILTKASGGPTVSKYVPPSQVQNAVASGGDPFYTNCLAFLAETWCRGSELRSLKWADVRPEIRCIEFTYPKEKKRKVIPITERVQQCLDTARILRPRSEYVFPRPDGRMLSKLMLWKGIKKIDQGLSPHRLRHSGITNALRNGASLFAVQQVAGHSQVTTTAGYTHTDLGDVKRAMEAATKALLEADN